MQLNTLDRRQHPDAVDVLSDAFADYPVMRFVIEPSDADYAQHVRLMISYLTLARFLKQDLVLGVMSPDGSVLGVANITRPGERQPPAALGEHREALWRRLGQPARERYEQLGEVWRAFMDGRPHYHLNMIGVRRSLQGRGIARVLLDAVHHISERDPDSSGVSLTTEDPANVPLYQRFGYVITGHTRVSNTLETWGFFRSDSKA